MPTPQFLPLQPVPPDQLRRIPGLPAVRELKTTFPKRAQSRAADARSAFRRWQDEIPPPKPPKNPDVRVAAVRPTRAALAKLRQVAESPVAPAEMLDQRMDQDALFGTLFSALATYEFMTSEAEYRRRRAAARNPERVDREWQQMVAGFQKAFAAAGMQVTEPTLRSFVKELTADRDTLNTIVRIERTAEPVGAASAVTTTAPVAAFVPVVDVVKDRFPIVSAILDLCDDPIAQGSFTKHFSHSITLKVKITYPCGLTWGGIKWCTKTYSLAGVSFSIGVNVGYRINCCGATAWGQAYAQACARIVGVEVCAGCSATITGVAGISRTPVGSNCQYGLGINAVLKCTLAGATILQLSYPFGWTVTGPCPPAGLCP